MNSQALLDHSIPETLDRPLDGRRILIIVENLPVPFDRRVWQEAITLREAGANVFVICPATSDYPTRYEELNGVHIYRHPMPNEGKGIVGYLMEYSSALFWETLLSWKIFFRHGFDTIQGCNPPDLIFLVAIQFKLFSKRFIFDHHDINPELYEAKFGSRGLFYYALRVCEWLTFKTADTVISTNESYRRIAIERGGKRPENVHIVRSGPNLGRVKSVPPDSSFKNGRDFLVGYVGVMGEQEGIDLLLEAARYIVLEEGRSDVHFALIGGGPSLDDLKKLCASMGLNDYVTFFGRAPDATLFAVLSTADVCVNPDRVNPMNDKSTMNKILEYMALSKPIVQFDVTEGRYSAQDASLYAEKNDPKDFARKILQLLEDPTLRREMGDFGRNRIETEMSWEHEIPGLLAAYRS